MDLHNKDSGDVLPVVIIGNGPSGICLSYLLSGHTPYFSPEAFHPNPILHRKLKENVHLPLFEQDNMPCRKAKISTWFLKHDNEVNVLNWTPVTRSQPPPVNKDLEYLCEGLEGRSSNPLAVLFDSLLLPDSDFGLDCASPLQWRYEPERAINHLVFGKGPPGGAWHAMEGSMLTLSLANWMELPGLNLKDWMREKRRNVRNDRATSADIASYYQHYVNTMGLSNNFAHGTTVTSVQRASLGSTVWHIKGIQRLDNGDAMPFFVQAENIVLATGTSDSPAHLGVEGESLPFVFHSFREFETIISSGRLCKSSDPVLVVGAGLTAADAVLCTHHLNVPVYHAFRRGVMDPALIFNQLPRLLYPEYHKVHQMMSQQQCQPSHSLPNLLSQHVVSTDNDHTNSSSSYPGYMSFPKHRVVSFNPNGKCVLEAEDGHHVVLQVSLALVLIGSQPNLSFLPEDGRQLGLEPGQPISCRRNPIKVETYTCESVREVGLYALGPLVGENFVRFLKGGALGTACHLMQKR